MQNVLRAQDFSDFFRAFGTVGNQSRDDCLRATLDCIFKAVGKNRELQTQLLNKPFPLTTNSPRPLICDWARIPRLGC